VPHNRHRPSALRRVAAAAVVLAFVGLSLASTPAAADPYAGARRQFMDAYAGATGGRPETPAPDSEVLKGYPLYPYLVAARLQRRLQDPAAAPEIQAFLDLHGDAPVARPLRREWLMALALRKQWGTYLAAYRSDVDDTIAARCNAFAARVALDRTEAMAGEVIELWSTPKSLPPACDPAFDWLKSRGLLTPDLVELRARAALDDGNAALARYLAQSLPESVAAPINQWAGLIETPRTSIEALITDPERTVDPGALLDGWQRYARSDAEAAADRYPALVQSRRLDARAASPFAIAVGVRLALSRNSRALEFFSRGHPDDFDEPAQEWHARAALWAGDWARVRSAINAMPDLLRNQNRWKYWAARATEELGDPGAARQGYAAIVPTDNWYAVLSAARLGQPFTPTLKPLGLSDPEMDKLAEEPAFVRTHELIRCDMQTESVAEWRTAYDALTPSSQSQAVGLAARWGWYLQAIAAAAKLGQFNDYDLLYPRPYDAEVRHGASLSGLPQDLIYAIIRQESLYRADARSTAGALGLMQLLPETARRTAKAWDLPAPTRASLLVPAVNVPLGSAFLRSLIDRWDRQAPLAIASYNAGPGAVKRWLPPAPMSTDAWVENIPYNETRGYVQRVSWHMIVFGWLGERKPRDVAGWLGTVRGPGADPGQPAE
jgi:soluble lytic murein transglycosylase